MWSKTNQPPRRNKFSEEQIREVYEVATSIKDACARLNTYSSTYKKYAEMYGFNIKGKSCKGRIILESEIKSVHEIATSGMDAARKLGVSWNTYKKYASLYGLYDEFIKRKRKNKPRRSFPPKTTIEDLCAGKHPSYSISYFKERLFRSGLKNRSCEICNYSERRITDGRSPLLICFLDGDKKNWALSNIKILCFNCSFVAGKENSYKKRDSKNSKKPWYDRLHWEGNGEKWSSYVLDRQKTATEETKGKDIDVTNTNEISDEELENLKNEVKKEIKD